MRPRRRWGVPIRGGTWSAGRGAKSHHPRPHLLSHQRPLPSSPRPGCPLALLLLLRRRLQRRRPFLRRRRLLPAPAPPSAAPRSPPAPATPGRTASGSAGRRPPPGKWGRAQPEMSFLSFPQIYQKFGNISPHLVYPSAKEEDEQCCCCPQVDESVLQVRAGADAAEGGQVGQDRGNLAKKGKIEMRLDGKICFSLSRNEKCKRKSKDTKSKRK